MPYVIALMLISGFCLLTGFNDGGNLLAAFLATRTMKVPWLLVVIVSGIALAPFVAGDAVAYTVATQIVNLPRAGVSVLDAALTATLTTLFLCWRLRLPTSASFALVGGLCGAGVAMLGPGHVVWQGVAKVVLSLLLAVIFGGMAGFGAYSLLVRIFAHLSLPRGEQMVHLQYLTSALVCFGFGANDAEKAIGLLAAAWLLMRQSPHLSVAWWMVCACALLFDLGFLWGGWRIARTMGHRVFRVRPLHALSSQMAVAAVVLSAAALGGPVSTTQTINSSMLGVASVADRQRVRWVIVRRLAFVVVFTLPMAFALGDITGLLWDGRWFS